MMTSMTLVCCLLVFFTSNVPPVFGEVTNHHIFYRKDNRAQLTNIEIVFWEAGKNQEPSDQVGIARLTAKLLMMAAKRKGQIEQLSILGTKVNIVATENTSTISIEALSENLDASLMIIKDMMQTLEVSHNDLANAKQEIKRGFQNILRRKAHLLMRNFALSQTYGINKISSLKTLKSLSLSDAENFHRKLLKNKLVFFKAISDLDSTKVSASLKPFCEIHEPDREIVIEKRARLESSQMPQAFVFRHSKIESVICYWLFPISNVGEDDYVAGLIAKTLEGVIRQVFREKEGLTYSPYCKLRSSGGIRYIEIFADPRKEDSEVLIQRLSAFLLDLTQNAQFWEQVRKVQEEKKESNVYGVSPQQSLKSEVYFTMHNISKRDEGFASVKEAEIHSFLNEYLTRHNLVMVLLGDKNHIVKTLYKDFSKDNVKVSYAKVLIE